MSVLNIAVVVSSANRDAAIARYKRLLDIEVVTQFDLPGGTFTVTVLPGISILSGNESSLDSVRPVRASISVESLVLTREILENTGWRIDGTLGSPDSFLARDPDENLIEFVERPENAETTEE